MSYCDLIKQESEFTYSANIQFDIENDSKLLRFIPNKTTIKLLKTYFTDIIRYCPNNHARILYGSYGTGKSHLLTVVCQLLSKAYTDGVAFETFLARIREYDEALANDILSYVRDTKSKPMLIVPIVFDFSDFNRCIYFSLKKKLEQLGYEIHLKSFFEQAAKLLSQWESNKESLERLERICKKHYVDRNELKRGLGLYDHRFNSIFSSIFYDMTYGVEYVYEVSSLIDVLDQTFSAISDSFRGILFVFDEFGRYLEDNIKSIHVKDVQNLAEYADHSDNNCHIILVSHKEIGQYTYQYGKALANEWKKVEGRYRADSMNSKQDQSLSLIKSVLIKNTPVWNNFKVRFNGELSAIYADAIDFKGFLIDADNESNPFDDGFPLHPISLFALDRLSKKVAQNDRTFFTYLASKEENSLYSFLRNHELNEFHFVGIDCLFDYFEPSIRAVQSDESYQWYKNLLSALAKNRSDLSNDTPEVKVLKVIATIGVVNDPSTLYANRRTLVASIDCADNIINKAIDSLCEKRIIKYSGIYDRFEFFDSSIFDIEKMISEAKASVSYEAVINTLNEKFVNFVLYPYSYNREYKISRILIPLFSGTDGLLKKSLTARLGPYYDGVLIMLLCDNETDDDILRKASREVERSIIIVNRNSTSLVELVKRFIAAKYLFSKKAQYVNKDPAFEGELQYHIQEITAETELEIKNWLEFTSDDISVFFNGRVCPEIFSLSHLSDLASRSMRMAYPKTLLVNNELLNKNNVSGSMSSTKKNVIRAMIAGEPAEEYFRFTLLSPEYISVRSVLVKNGFIKMEGVEQNSLLGGNQPQDYLLDYFASVIQQAKSDYVDFSSIYLTLKQSPYGLRDGYLSLIIAWLLIPHRKSLIISSHGVEQELSAELFEEIVKRPDDFTFTVSEWDLEQTRYIDELEQLFRSFIDSSTLSKNRLKAIYDAMMSHYKTVPKFARTTEAFLSQSTKNYRAFLEKSYSSYTDFFFNSSKRLAGNYPGSFSVISRSRKELDEVVDRVCDNLTRFLHSLIYWINGDSLAETLARIYNETWSENKNRAFDYYTNFFLDYVSRLPADTSDRDVILDLAKSFTGIEIAYWSDGHVDEFMSRTKEVLDKLDHQSDLGKISDSDIKLTLTSASGENKTAVFSRKELSGLGQTAKRKINATFSNFGLSITFDDKVQILLSLLDDLLEGK